MEKIETTVKHSQTKDAWNVIGARLGGKYKVARVPYVVTGNESVDEYNKNEALEHATFISDCLNAADTVSTAIYG